MCSVHRLKCSDISYVARHKEPMVDVFVTTVAHTDTLIRIKNNNNNNKHDWGALLEKLTAGVLLKTAERRS